MGFPERLQELRKKNKLTQTELGKLFNLSKQTISSYEKGGSTPSQETLIKFAKFFNVSADYLLNLTDFVSPEQKLKKTTLEEYILSANTLVEAISRISELLNNNRIDKKQFLEFAKLVYEKYEKINPIND